MAYNSLFSKTPALFVDQYAPVMGQADFNVQEMDRITTSQVFFRDLINNGFKDSNGKDLKIPSLVVAGMGPFFEWLDNWKITDDDAGYLASLKDPEGARLFSDPYINHLKNDKIRVSIDAMPEGELAFPDEPLFRITGPHYQVEMLEAALLNIVTAHTGWATIASQFWLVAQRLTKQAKLFEFGARRTAEWGGLGGSRSAYLAGWDGTSNLYAGSVYDIPTVGTMAHAFIMVRENEIEAFTKWIKGAPHLGVFLVDTYDTEEGIRNAIKLCKEHGVKLRGIRLDSGDIDELSRIARELLDAAGFSNATIMASDSLNIQTIHQVYQVKEAPLDSFGIGGNYVARRQDLGGSTTAVMKAAWVAAQGDGRDLIKYSNSPEKATLIGRHDVIRHIKTGRNDEKFYAGDTIIPLGLDVGDGTLNQEIISIPRGNQNRLRVFDKGSEFYRPIVPVMRDGKHLLPEFQAQDAKAALKMARKRFFHSMKMLEPQNKQIISPRLYETGVESGLMDKQSSLVRKNTLERQRRRNAKPSDLAA